MNLLWFENLLLMRLWVWNTYLVLLWNRDLAYPRALLPSGGPLSREFWQLITPLMPLIILYFWPWNILFDNLELNLTSKMTLNHQNTIINRFFHSKSHEKRGIKHDPSFIWCWSITSIMKQLENTVQSPNAVSMTGQRRRLWVNFKTALVECHVFAQSLQQTWW